MQLITFRVYEWIDRIADLPFFFRRFVHPILHIFQNSRFLLHVFGKLRRFGLVHFRKEHVGRQLLARQGACRQCGTCCNLLFTCPMLTRRGGCIVYGKCRPQACKTFPIDQRDIDEVNLANGLCGFEFSRKPFVGSGKTGRF